MAIRCPNCGRDNRDTANFCVGCGHQGLQLQVAQPWPQPQATLSNPQPLAQRQPYQMAPLPPSALMAQAPQPPAQAHGSAAGVLPSRTPILEGAIDTYNQDEVFPPADPAQVLAKVGIGLAVLPLALYFFAGLGIVLVVIIVLGGGIILAIFGALIGAFAKLFSLIMPRRRPQDRKITQVHLIVQEAAGSQSAILLYGDHIAGMLHKGDLVEVYGRRERSGLIRATRIDVVGAQFAPGTVIRRVVKGRRPFPAVVAASAWLIAVAAWLILYLPMLLQMLK